jgi:hypothetical protein
VVTSGALSIAPSASLNQVGGVTSALPNDLSKNHLVSNTLVNVRSLLTPYERGKAILASANPEADPHRKYGQRWTICWPESNGTPEEAAGAAREQVEPLGERSLLRPC